MIPVSQEIRTAINGNARTFKARLLTDLQQETELQCELTALTIHTGCGTVPIPGALFSSYIEGTVHNLNRSIKGYDLWLQLGVVTGQENDEDVIGWLPSNGLYKVTSTQTGGPTTSFVAVGRLTSNCQGAYVSRLTYPATIQSMLNEISTMAGVTIDASSFTTTGSVNAPIEGQSYAGALSTIAQLLGGFVTEDYQGKVHFYEFCGGSEYALDTSRFAQRPSFTEDPFEVTGVQCNVSEEVEIEVNKIIPGSNVTCFKSARNTTVSVSEEKTLPEGYRSTGGTFFYADIAKASIMDVATTEWDEVEEDFEAEFVWGTSKEETIFSHSEQGVNLSIKIIYNATTRKITLRLDGTVSNAYQVIWGAGTGFARYTSEIQPAVSFSYGTPNIVFENPYMTQQLFSGVQSKYGYFSFSQANAPLTLGNPCLEAHDYLTVEDTTGSEYTVPLLNVVSHFAGGFWQEISSITESEGDDSVEPVSGVMSARIDQIATASAVAQASASAARTSAENAQASAQEAQVSAGIANESANNAQGDAVRAKTAADSAQTAADSAQASARNASEYASNALAGLSTVQSVTETLNWITQHGTMAHTQDQEIDPTHVYFIQDNNGDYVVGGVHYSLVAEPSVGDLSTYYELSIDESLNNYVATHLAVTDEGLWLIPPEDNATPATSSRKILIAVGGSDHDYPEAGTYIINKIDGADKIMAKFTESIVQMGEDNKARLELSTDNMTSYNGDSVPYFDLDYDGGIVTSQYQLSLANVSAGGKTVVSNSRELPTGATGVISSALSNGYLYSSKLDRRITAITETVGVSATITYGILQISDLAVQDFVIGTAGTRTASVSFRMQGVSETFRWDYTIEYDGMGKITCTSSLNDGAGLSMFIGYIATGTTQTRAPSMLFGSNYSSDKGGFSSTLGEGLIAEHDHQSAIGKYNDNQSNTAFEIGNGTSSARSNAFDVNWNGETRLAIDTSASAGTTDGDLYRAIDALGWTSDVIE